MRSALPNWPFKKPSSANRTHDSLHDWRLAEAADSIHLLLNDSKVPLSVRKSLEDDYQQLSAMSDKLQHGHIHIAVFGRVSVGKSSILNALLGYEHFSVSPLHGETKHTALAQWNEFDKDGIYIIDTPGINELGGEEREKLAHQVCARSDLIVFVCDSDLTETELDALTRVCQQQRPVILALNKVDRYTESEIAQLITSIAAKTHPLIRPVDIVSVSASPSDEQVIRIDNSGQEHPSSRPRRPNLLALEERLWQILSSEGKLLAALNASLFAGSLSDEIAIRVAQTRRQLAEKVVSAYCVGKGLAVAINPIPVADLLAAAASDVAMITHLSRVYGLPITKSEAGKLIATIIAQLLALMGAVWGVNLASSVFKGVTFGMSTLITAGAQGGLAYYATYILGKVAEEYLIRGKSWGEDGPKKVVQAILDSTDRESILSHAKAQILTRLTAQVDHEKTH